MFTMYSLTHLKAIVPPMWKSFKITISSLYLSGTIDPKCTLKELRTTHSNIKGKYMPSVCCSAFIVATGTFNLPT